MPEFPTYKKLFAIGFALVVISSLVLSFVEIGIDSFVEDLFLFKKENGLYQFLFLIGFGLIVASFILREKRKR